MRTSNTIDQSQPGTSQAPEFAEKSTQDHQILVFKTNVQQPTHAENLVNILNTLYSDCRINFDLTDCDKILRLAGKSVSAQPVIRLLLSEGFTCELLE